MEEIVKQIHEFLIKTDQTIAVAESCTGGILSSFLTSFSGSSKYFKLGIVVYSNRAKEKLLKIPSLLIKQKGAVNAEVALLLAKNIRNIAKTDYGIGITGIAGPTGGTIKKPVGTVFIAVSCANRVICKKFRFSGSRSSIRKKSSLKALELLMV